MSPPQARSTGLHGLEDAEIVVDAVMDNGARRDGVENRRKLAAASFQEGELYMHTGHLAKGEQPTIASHRIASHRTVLHRIALHCIALHRGRCPKCDSLWPSLCFALLCSAFKLPSSLVQVNQPHTKSLRVATAT